MNCVYSVCMRLLIIFFSVFISCTHVSFGASELSKIKAEIKQTEQQNKKLAEKVQTSEREISKTKKELVKAADKVSSLEDQRAAMAKKIAELDAQRDKISHEMEKNQGRISDAASSILFVASHPNFDTENMREYVLMSAVMSGTAQLLDEEINRAAQQVKKLEKIRDARAIEKEK